MKLVILVVLVFSLAGCANGDPAASPSGSASASSQEPSVTPSSPASSETTISGTISAGTEPNCLLLDDHLLVINDKAHKAVAKAGASVTVTGHTRTGMMTTCMQGTPFIVSDIRAN